MKNQMTSTDFLNSLYTLSVYADYRDFIPDVLSNMDRLELIKIPEEIDISKTNLDSVFIIYSYVCCHSKTELKKKIIEFVNKTIGWKTFISLISNRKEQNV